MTTMPTAQRMTADEFLALPLDMDEYGWAPNLVEGELIVTAPKVPHQRLVMRFNAAFSRWIEAAPGRGEAIGPLNVLVDERNVYEPDVLWFAEGHDPGEHPHSIPALAVEVRSPSTWRYDIGAKKAGYERAGLPELWLVDDAARTVLVFRRSTPDAPTFDIALDLDAQATLESPLLPGFALPVAELF
jgi:Uma2 family endonuclease